MKRKWTVHGPILPVGAILRLCPKYDLPRKATEGENLTGFWVFDHQGTDSLENLSGFHCITVAKCPIRGRPRACRDHHV